MEIVLIIVSLGFLFAMFGWVCARADADMWVHHFCNRSIDLKAAREDAEFWRGMYKAEVEYQEEEVDCGCVNG